MTEQKEKTIIIFFSFRGLEPSFRADISDLVTSFHSLNLITGIVSVENDQRASKLLALKMLK